MMFCRNCGGKIDNNAYICPHCGVLVHEKEIVPCKKNTADELSIAAFVCSFLMSIVGLILSLISLNNHKADPDDNPSKKLAKTSLIIAICALALSIFFAVILIVGFALTISIY